MTGAVTMAGAVLVLFALLIGGWRRSESGHANVSTVFGTGPMADCPRAWALNTLAAANIDPSRQMCAIRELRRQKPDLSLAGAVALFQSVKDMPRADT